MTVWLLCIIYQCDWCILSRVKSQKTVQQWRCWDAGNFFTSYKYEKSSKPWNFKDNLTWKEALVISDGEQKCSKVKVGEEAWYYVSYIPDISDKHACKNARLHILDSLPKFHAGKMRGRGLLILWLLDIFRLMVLFVLGILRWVLKGFHPAGHWKCHESHMEHMFQNQHSGFLLGSAHSAEMTLCMDSSSLVNSFLHWMVLLQQFLEFAECLLDTTWYHLSFSMPAMKPMESDPPIRPPQQRKRPLPPWARTWAWSQACIGWHTCRHTP